MSARLPLAALLAALAGPAVAAPAAPPSPSQQGLDLSNGGPIEVTSRDGMEWRQNEQVVIARGDARAVRGDVTVLADSLIAHYRKKAGSTPSPTPVSAGPSLTPGGGDTGNNEVYRLEADGHVKIFNQSDIAVGDHAIYDIDQAVLLLTGKDLSITTPNDVMTARDTMEYWPQKHMMVGRGLAVVTTSDGRRITADVLVGYTAPQGQPPGPTPATPVAAKPKVPGTDPAATGKLQRAEAFGHVEIRTAAEIVTGDRGVYVADTGMARIAGHVHITRGLNQLNGDEALVNMRTGVSTLIHQPGGRVRGLIVPNDANAAAAGPGSGSAAPARPKP